MYNQDVAPVSRFSVYDQSRNYTLKSRKQLLSLDSILTQREMECFMLTIQGKTAKQIAEIANLSIKTIETYLSRLKEKLGCKQRSELFDIAFEYGILQFNIED